MDAEAHEIDDVSSGDSTFFMAKEPVEQEIARKKEQAKTLQALDEIKRVIKHFDERIEFRSRIESLNVDLNEDPAMHQKKCELNDMLRLALIEERNLLIELLETHAKNR